jgi:hypothetical protein
MLRRDIGSEGNSPHNGHERLSTTQIYTKVTLTGLRKHYNKTHPKEKRERGSRKILVGE